MLAGAVPHSKPDPAASTTPTLVASNEAMTPTDTGTAVVQLVAGRYAIEGLVGRGGMGSVYRAYDRELDEVIALKVLRRELLESPEMIEQFRSEVRLARRVAHPNVARTYDIGQHGVDRFMTMEFVEGESLAVRIARDRRIDSARTVSTARSIAKGLAAAHRAGVVHRDLKPENVLLGRDGRVAITDFGIACMLVDPDRPSREAGVVGTPLYMAPEQVRVPNVIDARTDIYALGAVVYEMLTGKPPWSDANLLERLSGEPPDPRTHYAAIPSLLAALTLRCLHHDPGKRYTSAEELLDAFDAAAAQGLPDRVTLPPRHESRALPTPLAYASPSGKPLPTRDKTVAVLPLDNAGGAEDAYLADELTEEVIDLLSVSSHLRVRPYPVSAAHRSSALEPAQVGQALDVQVLVHGSLRRVEQRLVLTVRLTTTADGFQLWARRFECSVTRVLNLAGEVARAVMQRLSLDELRQANPRIEAERSDALELYLRGRAALRNVWPSQVEVAVDLLERARVLAPADPLIAATTALARTRRWFWSGSPEDAARAREAAERAAALAPESAEASLALAGVVFMSNQHEAALRHLADALARSPSQPGARELLGRILLELGLTDEALHQLRAAAKLDPRLSQPVEISRALALGGRWDEVEETLRAWENESEEVSAKAIVCARLALWSDRPRVLLALAPPLHRVSALGQRYVAVVTQLFQPGARLLASHRASLEAYLDEIQDSLRFTVLIHQLVAEVCARFGDRSGAEEQVASAVAAGLVDLGWLELCPALASVRHDPWFVGAVGTVRGRTAAARRFLDRTVRVERREPYP
jgi:serine/threonine protein kinase